MQISRWMFSDGQKRIHAADSGRLMLGERYSADGQGCARLFVGGLGDDDSIAAWLIDDQICMHSARQGWSAIAKFQISMQKFQPLGDGL